MGRGEERSQFGQYSITFEEATEVFLDPLSITVPDPDHSVIEQRFATIGMTAHGPVVAVIHTDADDTHPSHFCPKGDAKGKTRL